MTSTRERVSFPGIIRGHGQEATCAVYAIKVTLAVTGQHGFAKHEIKSVSRRLPKGAYEVTFNGKTIQVQHEGGDWLA